MKKYEKIKTQIIKKNLAGIVCDCCLKSIDGGNGYPPIEISIYSNYGSSYDGNDEYLDFCDSCLKKINHLLQNKIHWINS